METEERARLMGWVPQDEFKGDPDRWTSAEDYVAKADTLMPIMRAQNKQYEEKLQMTSEELKATRHELQSLKKTLENVVRVNTKVSEREYERALETIRKEQAAAIENNDGARFQELEADKDKLIQNKPEKIEVDDRPKGNPEFEAWVEKNQWYNTDNDLREYADYAASVVSRSHPNLAGKEFFEEVKRKVMGVYPAKFENPNRQNASDVDGGSVQGAGDTKKKGKTYRDLPQDAKQACDAFVKDGLMTKEDYIKEYFEGEEQ